MTDEVNNPSHYNQNGIEEIDVIETYAKHDFRLANVLKYVCRAGYKGHPLQDLQKAQWYLNRVVSEMEELDAAIEELEATDRALGPAIASALEAMDEVDAAIEKKDELYQTFEGRYQLKPGDKGYTSEPAEDLLVHTSPDRIAGDDDSAKRLKDKYYDFNRFEIKGYCANCDKELAILQPHITDYSFDDYAFEEGVKFCSAACVKALKVWQGR